MTAQHTAAQTAPVTPPHPHGGSAPESNDFEDFIYLISHDVRSSVRALLELPQWIVEDLEEAGFPIEGSLATSIAMMNRHTGRLDRMLVDLLTFSRVGRMQEVVENDIAQALEQVLDEIKLPGNFEFVHRLTARHVTMGERDLLTLLDALLRNAVKHHDRDDGRIVIATAHQGTDFVLTIADDGPGIDEEHRERVFGAMRTLRARDEVEGSGMGLTTVRKIAGFYGGTATLAASPYGRGTLVEVRVPSARPAN